MRCPNFFGESKFRGLKDSRMGCIAIRQRRNHLASFLSQSFKLLLRSVLDEESHPHLLALALLFFPSLSPSLGSHSHFPFSLPLSLFLSPTPPSPLNFHPRDRLCFDARAASAPLVGAGIDPLAVTTTKNFSSFSFDWLSCHSTVKQEQSHANRSHKPSIPFPCQ